MKVSSGGRILGPDAVDPVAKGGGWGFDSAAQPCRALALAQSSRSPFGGDRVRLLASRDERHVGGLRLARIARSILRSSCARARASPEPGTRPRHHVAPVARSTARILVAVSRAGAQR